MVGLYLEIRFDFVTTGPVSGEEVSQARNMERVLFRRRAGQNCLWLTISMDLANTLGLRTLHQQSDKQNPSGFNLQTGLTSFSHGHKLASSFHKHQIPMFCIFNDITLANVGYHMSVCWRSPWDFLCLSKANIAMTSHITIYHLHFYMFCSKDADVISILLSKRHIRDFTEIKHVIIF